MASKYRRRNLPQARFVQYRHTRDARDACPTNYL
jgi:hypothetical protein